MESIMIKWSEMPINVPIKIVLDELDKCRTYKNWYILLKAFFDFDKKGIREFELIVPYRRFIWAVRALPVSTQIKMKDKPMEMNITKLDRGLVRIENVKEWESI